jgi:integrase
MNDLLKLVDEYIESKAFAWSKTTQASERSRLRSVVELIDLQPAAAFTELRKAKAPYTVKTTFIRLGDFYDFLLTNKNKSGLNLFKLFVREHAQLFKNAYEKERLNVDYQEAKARIERIADPGSRAKALELLASGVRYAESFTAIDGFITGKGGKRRKMFLPAGMHPTEFKRSYSAFRKDLARVGLKPHTLRKLAATRFVEMGAREADLMQLMGWSSIATAASYLQCQKDEQLEQLVFSAFSSKSKVS